jgi:ubiquitin-conjugating enzyme E2 variant
MPKTPQEPAGSAGTTDFGGAPRAVARVYSAWHRATDALALVLFAAGSAYLLIDTLLNGRTPGYATLIAVVVSAVLAADFVSGLVHFLADNFGNPDTPLLGRMFIFPFREHHVDPLAITRHGFLETNGASCLVALPALAATLLFTTSGEHTLLRFSILAFLMAIFLTNQIHKWAHTSHPPHTVRLLQRCRIILSPRSHAIHHTAPHDSNYCITTGWLNDLLERVGFFRRLLTLLRRQKHGRPVS